MNWQEIISFLGGASIFATLIGFIGKTAIDAYVAGRVESYKSDLEKITVEHTIRFQRLHGERADVIKSVYTHISNLDESLSSALGFFQSVNEPSLEEKVTVLAKNYNDLRNYYVSNRIFLTKDICQKIDTIISHAKDIFINVTAYPVNPLSIQYKYNPAILGERHAFWETARSLHNKEFSQIKIDLEFEFRKIIGIDA